MKESESIFIGLVQISDTNGKSLRKNISFFLSWFCSGVCWTVEMKPNIEFKKNTFIFIIFYQEQRKALAEKDIRICWHCIFFFKLIDRKFCIGNSGNPFFFDFINSHESNNTIHIGKAFLFEFFFVFFECKKKIKRLLYVFLLAKLKNFRWNEGNIWPWIYGLCELLLTNLYFSSDSQGKSVRTLLSTILCEFCDSKAGTWNR